MAIDQREALIAAVRAQVEKEKAAKAEKLRKEQEAMQLANKGSNVNKGDSAKPKYKTLSAEELAKIEERKRRKAAAELGITLDEDKPAEDVKEEAEVKAAEDVKTDGKEAEDKTAEQKTDDVAEKQPEGQGPLKLKLKTDDKSTDKKSDEKAKLQPAKVVEDGSSVKVIGDEKDTVSFGTDGKTNVIAEENGWKQSEAAATAATANATPDDLINIVPNRKTPTNDVESMYDIDDEDDNLGAEVSKFAGYDDSASKAEKEDIISKKEAEKKAADAAKKASIEEARKKAMDEERKKRAEAEEAKKKAMAEEALKKEEARKKRLMEAEKRAEQQARRIAEAEAKSRAEAAAKKKAEEEARRKAEEEARRKVLEEQRKKAAEEARRKAEEEARAKAKEEALKKAEEARKKAEEAEKLLKEAQKLEAEVAKKAEEARKKAEAEAKKKAEEEAKRKAEEEARKKAEEEAKRKAEEEAKKKAEEEAKRKAEEEAKRKAAEEARKQAEEAAKKAAEEARKKAEEAMKVLEAAKKAEEAALKQAEENRKKAAEEAKKFAEEQAEKKAAEEAAKKAEAEAAKKAAEEAKKKAAEEAKKKAAEEAAKKAEDEARRKQEEENRRAEEEAKKKAEAARKILEEAKKAEEAALKEASDAAIMKIDLTLPSEEGKLPLAAYYLEKYTSSEKLGAAVVSVFNKISKGEVAKKNLVIRGEHGFGLTMLGEDFARSFYDMGVCKAKTIAKIKANALNKVKLADAMVKLSGGCLVVENAGLIQADRVKEILKLSAADKNDIIVIFTGEAGSIDRLFDNVPEAKNEFVCSLDAAGLGNADMLGIAKGYVGQKGFKADDSFEGIIRNSLMAMETGNIDRLLKLIDDAMLKCEEREKSKGREGKKYLVAEDFK